jgi:hypothetical protein
MADDLQILAVLKRHNVPFVVIGGHAVVFHGYSRNTEDADVVWLRSPENEGKLLQALTEMDAHYISDDIDPGTGIERIHPVTPTFIQTQRLLMLTTRYGFLDIFDYIPGLPKEDVQQLFASSIEHDGLRYASLYWLRQMKCASGRSKDQLDLENLPE